MSRVSLTLMTLTSSLLAVTAVHAGGLAPVAPTPVVIAPAIVPMAVVDSNWGGFYAGLAYGSTDLTVSSEGAEDEEFSGDGPGIFAGYNHDFGQYVLGAELSHDQFDDIAEGTDASLTRLKARAGYDGGSWMPYAMLGLASMEVSGGGTSVDDSGFTYGLGVDFAVTPNVVLGAEISRSTFEDFDGQGIDIDADVMQLRASYKF